MVNFLVLSLIKPAKYFFGCLPLLVGMIILPIVHIGFSLYDFLEAPGLFENDNISNTIVNKWITLGIQIAFGVLFVLNVILRKYALNVLTYILILGYIAYTIFEKLMKIRACQNISADKSFNTYFMWSYGFRSACEIIVMFYFCYLAYSFSEQTKEKNKEKEEEELNTSQKAELVSAKSEK